MGEYFAAITEKRAELFVHYNITLKKSQFLTAIYSSPHIAKNISQHDKKKPPICLKIFSWTSSVP